MFKTIRKKIKTILCNHDYVVVSEFVRENKNLINVYVCKKCGYIHKEVIT